MNENIKKNIQMTVAYYWVMDQVLTSFELWRFYVNFTQTRDNVTLGNVIQVLQEFQEKKVLFEYQGFWGLEKQPLTIFVAQRSQRQKISIDKIKRLRKWMQWIQWLPFFRGLLIDGTLASKKATGASDWDVLVILKPNRIWIGRLIVSGFFQLMGKRRHGEKIKDRFCLNHFMTESGYIFEEQNEYSAKEIAWAIPIVGEKQAQKFFQLNNFWQNQFLPNFRPDRTTNHFLLKADQSGQAVQVFLEGILEKFFFMERLNLWLAKKMIARIESNPKTQLPGADIRYNNQSLVFLPVPQREKIMQKMQLCLTKHAQ